MKQRTVSKKCLQKWISDSVEEILWDLEEPKNAWGYSNIASEYYLPMLRENPNFATICIATSHDPIGEYEKENALLVEEEEHLRTIDISIRKHDEHDMESYAYDWDLFGECPIYTILKTDVDDGFKDAAATIWKWCDEIMEDCPPVKTFSCPPTGYSDSLYYECDGYCLYKGVLIGWRKSRGVSGMVYRAYIVPPLEEITEESAWDYDDAENVYDTDPVEITKYDYLRMSVGDPEIISEVAESLLRTNPQAMQDAFANESSN